MKPDYKNASFMMNGEWNPETMPDNGAIERKRFQKIHPLLDEILEGGWTLVYHSPFTNSVAVINGGKEVSKMDYAITQLIQATLNEAFKK